MVAGLRGSRRRIATTSVWAAVMIGVVVIGYNLWDRVFPPTPSAGYSYASPPDVAAPVQAQAVAPIQAAPPIPSPSTPVPMDALEPPGFHHSAPAISVPTSEPAPQLTPAQRADTEIRAAQGRYAQAQAMPAQDTGVPGSQAPTRAADPPPGFHLRNGHSVPYAKLTLAYKDFVFWRMRYQFDLRDNGGGNKEECVEQMHEFTNQMEQLAPLCDPAEREEAQNVAQAARNETDLASMPPGPAPPDSSP